MMPRASANGAPTPIMIRARAGRKCRYLLLMIFFKEKEKAKKVIQEKQKQYDKAMQVSFMI